MYNYEKFFVKSSQPFALCELLEGNNNYNFTFIDVNIAFAKLFNKDRSSYLDKKLTDIFIEDIKDNNIWQRNLKKLNQKRDKVTLSLFSKSANNWLNYELVHIEKNYFTLRVSVGVVDDFTGKDLEEFTKIDLDILCVLDNETKILKINDAFKTTLQYNSQELLYFDFLDLVHQDDQKTAIKKLRKIYRENVKDSFVSRMKTSKNRYKHIEWYAIVSNNMVYLSGRDISKVIKQERLLHTAATTDFLTKLYNRNYFYTIIDKEINNADYTNEHLILAILDIDHFKLVNDVWGHVIGDKVLVELASILKKVILKPNLVARLGGEEFLILIKSDISEAYTILEILQETINNHFFEYIGNLTCSYGLAKRLPTESFKSWYRRVDEALYHAKKTGRDRIVIAKDKVSIITTSFLEWNEEWNCANEMINTQHRELLEDAKRLIFITYPNEGNDKIFSELERLIKNVKNHFLYEEKLLKKSNYPDLLEHKKIHEELLYNAENYIKLYFTKEITAQKLFTFYVDDFIMNHLIKEDVKYFKHLEAHQNEK